MPEVAGETRADASGIDPPEGVVRAGGQVLCADYEWHLPDDRLEWTPAVSQVLGPTARRELCTGRAYAAIVRSGSGGREQAVRACVSAGLTGEPQRFDIRYSVRFPGVADDHDLLLIDRGVCHFDEHGRVERVVGRVFPVPSEAVNSAGGTARILPRATSGRRPLSILVEEWLAQAGRDGSEFAFVLIGIDHFSRLNDAYGFDVVDQAIEVLRLRLHAELDASEAMGRFSVGTFGLLLKVAGSDALAARVREIVAAAIGRPARTEGGALAVSVSAGAVMAPRQAGDLVSIFSRAQDTLHRARQVNRGAFELFTPALDRTTERRANLRFVDSIVGALEEQRVSLAYQPIARAGRRDIAFHEALVRVHGLDGEVLDGAAIIPTAERFGLTDLIDCRTLQLAFAALADDPQLRLSVNVSPTSMNDGGWLELMRAQATGDLCERLIIEITESARIVDIDRIRQNIGWLHARGCKVAIDDFGVGHTSFRALRHLGVDILKIDGSFISSLTRSDADLHFVRALIELAGNLGMDTVAEWVLDEPTARQLEELGCTYLQGQLIGLAQAEPMRPARAR